MPKNQSRRQFLAGMCALGLEAQQRTDPDVILYNANILTIDPANPTRKQSPSPAGASWPSARSAMSAICRRRAPANRSRRQDSRARVHRRPHAPLLCGHPAPALGGLRPPVHRRDSDRHSRARGKNACRAVGRRLQIRRHQDHRRPPADAGGSRCRGRPIIRSSSSTAAATQPTSIPSHSKRRGQRRDARSGRRPIRTRRRADV